MNLSVVRQPSANTVRVAASIKTLLDEIWLRTAPPGVRLGQLSYDQADMIKQAIGNVGGILHDLPSFIIVALVVAFLGGLPLHRRLRCSRSRSR
ncbi:MAG: hypothetical protein U1E53_00800 [Dongiaceae bacterium]